jgi:hypothetical protein
MKYQLDEIPDCASILELEWRIRAITDRLEPPSPDYPHVTDAKRREKLKQVRYVLLCCLSDFVYGSGSGKPVGLCK